MSTLSENQKSIIWRWGLIAIVVGGYSLIFGTDFLKDTKPVSPDKYSLMSHWILNPIQFDGQDYAPLIPLIRDAMKNKVVDRSEWKEIQLRKEEINNAGVEEDREAARLKLLDTLNK